MKSKVAPLLLQPLVYGLDWFMAWTASHRPRVVDRRHGINMKPMVMMLSPSRLSLLLMMLSSRRAGPTPFLLIRRAENMDKTGPVDG